MGAAYSSLGRTKVLYATSFVLLGVLKVKSFQDIKDRSGKPHVFINPMNQHLLRLVQLTSLF